MRAVLETATPAGEVECPNWGYRDLDKRFPDKSRRRSSNSSNSNQGLYNKAIEINGGMRYETSSE
jgi:hypothetical protein